MYSSNVSYYLDMGDPDYERIEEAVRKTYKNSCIVWIEGVHNDTLRGDFEKYKDSLKEPNIKELFHGTNERIARKICWDGFDPTFNKVSAYGKGVYFSTRAEYSRNYSKSNKDGLAYMLVSDVALGLVGQGKSNTPIPKGFNSATNNVRNPDMYIVDKRAAALPKYIVAFYPKAK